ncbi:spc7 protein [Paramyrothecium foliicola]|nr:spc7 protein [Paramyrothecium foliicola]
MSGAGNSSVDVSDEILDRDWKPNGRRPQSTIARSFSAELMDIFRIENSLSDLDQEVDKSLGGGFNSTSHKPNRLAYFSRAVANLYPPSNYRRQNVDKNTQELASIEKRIRDMEARLQRNGGNHPRTPIPQSNTVTQATVNAAASLPKDEKNPSSRPGTARAAQQAPGSGIMPPTPGASEGEYYLVTRADLDDQHR